MNERLHHILDGNLPTHDREQMFRSPEEEQEFLELKALTGELRRNADQVGLSASEKLQIGAGLAAALGFEATPAQAAPAGAGAPPTKKTPNWVPRSIAALFLGILLGLGGFVLLNNDEAGIEPAKTVGVPVHATTPAFFPFALPEPSQGAMCDSLVTTLQDSIRALQQPAQASANTKKVTKKKWRSPYPKPVTGDAPPGK